MSGRHTAVASAAFLIAIGVADVPGVPSTIHVAEAAPRWVDRPITLPQLVFAGDVGFGVANVRRSRMIGAALLHDDVFGAGMNLEAALGITDSVELGLRTGLRFGDDGKVVLADAFARTLWTETWGTNGPTRPGTVANPELKLRWAAYSGSVAEIGLDGRVFLPVEDGSRFGLMFGVPIALHLGHVVRLDTGAYLPIAFHDHTFNAFSIPLDLWIQATNKLWLGPMTALRFIHPSVPNSEYETNLLIGFGMGYQVANAVDLKWQIFHPAINQDDGFRYVGGGFGLQFRIE